MKKSLLFIIPSLASGGAEKSLITLLTLLDYDKYEVDLLLFRKTGLFVGQIPEQVNVITAGESYDLFDGSMKKAVISFLKNGKPRLALDRIGYSFAVRRADGKKEKSIWRYLKKTLPHINKNYDTAIGYLEGMPVYYCIDMVNAKKKIGYMHTDYNRIASQKSMDKKYFEKLDLLVGVSQKCCDIAVDFFPILRKKTAVVENITSPQIISSMAQSDENVFNAENKETVILTIGRLAPPKGIDNAINACARLIEMGYKIKWYQIGAGSMKEELEELVKKVGVAGRFFMLGERSNPYPYIEQCDIYVQPSYFEGKSIAVDEVKCLNKPIVVTNFETVFDQIQDQKNGLISKKEPNDIAEKIGKLIDSPQLREALSNNLKSEKKGNEEEIKKFYGVLEN